MLKIDATILRKTYKAESVGFLKNTFHIPFKKQIFLTRKVQNLRNIFFEKRQYPRIS